MRTASISASSPTRRITCAARPTAKSWPRCRNGPITPRKFRRSTKARSIRAQRSALAAAPAFIKEAERAIRELGLRGIFIHSSHKGHYPDDDEARPFWELVQELDVPVMIHPPHLGFGEERMKEYRLASSIGRPFDLCLALGRLIMRAASSRISRGSRSWPHTAKGPPVDIKMQRV